VIARAKDVGSQTSEVRNQTSVPSPDQLSAIALSIKLAFRSPPCEIETSSHSTVQTDYISLAGAGKWTTQGVMATAKQAPADGFNDAMVVPDGRSKLRPDQP
jgi:hypothetical protein